MQITLVRSFNQDQVTLDDNTKIQTLQKNANKVIDNHMSLCDNFRLCIATLANRVANLVANATHVYLYKLYKADRKAHPCIVLPTLSKSLLMVTANEVSQTRNSYTYRRNSTKLHFTCLLAIARMSSLSLPVQR